MKYPAPSAALAHTLWLLSARARGGKHWIANANCEFQSITIAEQTQPVSVQALSSRNQSYVLSPRSAWINYAKEEANRLAPRKLQWLAKILGDSIFFPLSLLLRGSGLDRAVSIGNRLISTNLYPDWSLQEFKNLTEELVSEYPNYPYIFRNICPEVNPHFYDYLQRCGWSLVPARMIYLCDPQNPAVWKHNHVKKDVRLLHSEDIEIVGPEQMKNGDLPRLRDLFRQVFIHKHSTLNPDFTIDFFEFCLESSFLELHGLRHKGQMVGVLGVYEFQGSNWITTPLIGYDTTMPQELGLYRRLMALLLQIAKQKNKRLHYSSGASEFKQARGGLAYLEYTAIYSQHLNTREKLCNKLFAKTLQYIAPRILKRVDQY
ncbi:hypothetical protein [Undibacterium parvum]|uniref:Uncharacterized protein n=1 Tax=Undibacterium parvum TaxID=401471 RepID=A0A3Q9BQH9_9BURK|nr:hypothetical protein [Undibacterium parvum]AZP12140.1 hypothetical protein EJN92_09075 [Undibacterium parvum]